MLTILPKTGPNAVSRLIEKFENLTFRTIEIAQSIIGEHHIDVIHQLNMIGFREPGFLWKIKDIPFVWGPVGGMEFLPTGYLAGTGLVQKLKVYLKNFFK